MGKTQKMIFAEDKFYNDFSKPLYEKGVIYDVPSEMVDRWLKRGGKLVEGFQKTQDLEPVQALEEVAQAEKSEDHHSHAEQPAPQEKPKDKKPHGKKNKGRQ